MDKNDLDEMALKLAFEMHNQGETLIMLPFRKDGSKVRSNSLDGSPDQCLIVRVATSDYWKAQGSKTSKERELRKKAIAKIESGV